MALGVKNLPANAGDTSPGVGNGNPLQYSCLENPMDRDWRATVHGVAKRWTQLTEHARAHTHTHTHNPAQQLTVPLFLPESESCSVVCDSLQPHGLESPWNSPGQNTGAGSLSLLQGIFPSQGSNPGLPNCRQILYQLSHQGSPRILEGVPIPSPADLPNPGIELGSPALQVDSLPTQFLKELQ